ncbi:RdgB/HAM1 family non-canonical purine NTP pyrophosphatase [Friedmanniella luteola]|uniref:RdgB/HAM1 family non-canonical purine NTP pyrophosphatase n=1 Tax=Friedmanniella luteola TaxID=546871 RepID=UPI000B88EEE9|nr:RdgB/HAM1 family non-canonical purine NTP pyrophosphatase [Friedmanniella luteola]
MPSPAGAQVVLATNNAKKLTELRRIVAGAAPDVEVLALADVPGYPEPAETEQTFEGNALLKARACVAATGLPAVADDSGLAVDRLNGMPGVRSARWSGADATDAANNALLLRQLFDLEGPEQRRGQFVCAMALVLPDGTEHVRLGVMPGHLRSAPAGENGFGYDPLFVPDGHDRTTAQLEPAAKDAISHRGRAIRALVPVLVDELRRTGAAVPEEAR